MKNPKIKLREFKKIENMVNRENLIFEIIKYICNLRWFKTEWPFPKIIFGGKINFSNNYDKY